MRILGVGPEERVRSLIEKFGLSVAGTEGFAIDGATTGRHPWPTAHMLFVLRGSARVIGKDSVEIPVIEGQAAYWDADEWFSYTAGDNGLGAISIEGDAVHPEMFAFTADERHKDTD